MGSNEKKNLIIMYSKFIILFEFIQKVDCHITIYSSSYSPGFLIKKKSTDERTDERTIIPKKWGDIYTTRRSDCSKLG